MIAILAMLCLPIANAGAQTVSSVDDPSTDTITLLQGHISAVGGDSAAFVFIARIIFTPLIKLDGTEITLFKLGIALLLLLLGLYVARRVTNAVLSRLLQRFRVSTAVGEFLTRVLHIVLVGMVALFVLDFTGIPLSVFAFLGGAVAIAVGFGAQELLANFIGGLILIFEQPIRKGDLIEYEGQQGMVQEIGARCTRLRMPGRSDLLIPNRKILENALVNHTLTDPFLRTEVSVGVAYGSPVKTVQKLILQAILEHPEVIPEEMPPVVLFEEFGDNSLLFHAMWVVRVKSFLDQRIIKSDVRIRIEELFRENNIVISFPQRDVHLNTLEPLEISLINRPTTGDPKS